MPVSSQKLTQIYRGCDVIYKFMRANLLALLLLCMGTGAYAQVSAFKVSTIERKPFAFKVDDQWTGFTIDLWNMIAANLNGQTEFVEAAKFSDMLDMVTKKEVDAAAANISITSSREALMDFSQPIFDSGLLILSRKVDGGSIWTALLNPQLISLMLGAVGLFIVAGGLIAFFERNNPHFQDTKKPKGLEEGIWWAVSVVTNASFTIFTPLSAAGRALSYLLIVIGLFVVSTFVAQITASLTVETLRTQVDGVNDLRDKRVATTSGSTSSRYLLTQAIDHQTFDQLSDMYVALESGDIDAIVHDAPILAYYAKTEGKGKFQTSGRVFSPEQYGIAVPENSMLREQINREVLSLRETGEYRKLVTKWFGSNY
jgi:polar amino acid transport system substrate-binding protein